MSLGFTLRTGLRQPPRRLRSPAAISLAAILACAAFAADRAPHRPQPAPVQGWAKAFAQQQRELAAKRADILFVGDSLTEFWTATGRPIWDLEFHEFRAVNFGLAGDRTEHILHRVTRTNLAAQPPRAVVLLAGTNNLAQDPPDSPLATVSGVKAIVDHIVQRCPGTRLFLLTLPPNGHAAEGPLRQRVLETNRQLKAVKWPAPVQLIDIYPIFSDAKDHWKPGMTLDGTHFSQDGYDHLGRALAPVADYLRSLPDQRQK